MYLFISILFSIYIISPHIYFCISSNYISDSLCKWGCRDIFVKLLPTCRMNFVYQYSVYKIWFCSDPNSCQSIFYLFFCRSCDWATEIKLTSQKNLLWMKFSWISRTSDVMKRPIKSNFKHTIWPKVCGQLKMTSYDWWSSHTRPINRAQALWTKAFIYFRPYRVNIANIKNKRHWFNDTWINFLCCSFISCLISFYSTAINNFPLLCATQINLQCWSVL